MTTAAVAGTIVETPAEPKPGTPEYNAKMAALYDAAQGKPAATTETPAAPAMPEGGSEKFYDKATGAYNWSAHVTELNFQLAQKGIKPAEAAKPATEAKPAVEPNAGKTAEEVAAAAAAQAAANPQGLSEADWAAFNTEITSAEGKLAETSRAKLEKIVPKAVLDNFERLVRMEREVAVKTAMEYAGGEQELNGLLAWAKDNLPEADKQAHNTLLASENWKAAIDSLKSRRGAASRTSGEPAIISGAQPNGTGSGAGAPFANQQEMVTAMSKKNDKGQKLYQVDENYRNAVRQRIALSNF